MISNAYVQNVGELSDRLNKILAADIPEAFNQGFLNSLGLTKVADRKYISVFKTLGFIDENGVPTEKYTLLKSEETRKQALGNAIRNVYSEILNLNPDLIKSTPTSIAPLFEGKVDGIDNPIKRKNIAASCLCPLLLGKRKRRTR